MTSRLLLVALFLAAFGLSPSAQTVLFSVPDSVCVRQSFTPVNLLNPASGNTYYWSFCSGFLQNTPAALNLGAGFGFTNPSAIDVAKDNGNYFAFVASQATNELYRLDYGTSFANAPAVTNLGTLGGAFPAMPNALYLYQSGGSWYLFAVGGTTAGNSTLARLDFGASLSNTPTAANLGNPGGAMINPRGIFVAAEGGKFYGYLVNYATSELVQLNFGASITTAAPTLTNLGNPVSAFGAPTLLGPTDIAPVLDPSGNWHLFITDQISNSLTQVDLGNSLLNAPLSQNLGSFGNQIFGPSAITLAADCGMMYAFITDQLTNELTRLDMPDYNGVYTATDLGNLGGVINQPSDITRVIREGSNLYAYILNFNNNSLAQLIFSGCNNASVPADTTATPPAIAYDQPGLYNIYLAVNEGLPNAQVECHQVQAVAIPPLVISNDTMICQGDTARLLAYSIASNLTTWTPAISVVDTDSIVLQAYPDYSLTYFATINFPFGCVVDTFIHVTVSKNHADAGPDRTISDGASTVLGGPYTSLGQQFIYQWTPVQYIDNQFSANPTVSPSSSLTYYLTVTNTDGCYDIDTVNVTVACNDLNMPNAFAPEGRDGSNRFGLANRQIVQLNYFRIFDRWGKEVFMTTDATKYWDGKVDGEPAPPGVYVWEADGFCISNIRFSRSGNVTLIR